MADTDLPVPPWRSFKAPRARTVKIPLTRAQIVQAGLRIVAAEGIDAASMRRLAAEFDTGPSSLYAHVANKDELIQLMFDEVCKDVVLPEPDPARWQEQIKEIARRGHAAMSAHGDIARAALATIPTGPNALRISEAMLGTMLSGGLPPRVAGWALDRIFLYISADAYEGSLYRARYGASNEQVAEFWAGFSEQLATYYEELPADRFPHLRANSRALIGGDDDQRFEFGLNMLIDGLSRYVPR